MKVIAIATGFDGRQLREIDSVFEMPEGSKGTWFVPYEEEEPVKQKPSKAKAGASGASEFV